MKLFKNNKALIILLAIPCIVGLLTVAQITLAVSTLETDGRTTTASSTPEYLTASTNTVSYTADTLGVDMLDMNIQFIASTTSSVLTWTYQFSDDNVDWFGEDLDQVSSTYTVSHASTTIAHTWKPDVATVVRKNIGLLPLASRYVKITFSTTGANGSVWGRFARKKVKN